MKKSGMSLVEVDFYDMRMNIQGREVAYNNRVARVIVDDDKMIPHKLVKQGFNVEKVSKTRVIKQNVSEDEIKEHDEKYVAPVQAFQTSGKKKSTGSRSKKSPSKFLPTKLGIKELKTIDNQSTPIANALLKTKSPLSIDELVELVGKDLKTSAQPKPIIAFYISKWKKLELIHIVTGE